MDSFETQQGHDAAVRVEERRFDVGGGHIVGDLVVPSPARGLVVFAHGSGSSRHSRRNRQVAAVLQDAGLATLLLDLLTAEEDEVDRRSGQLRFDIALLAERVAMVLDQVGDAAPTQGLDIGLFGASTGAAAALVAAAVRPEVVRAVVSRGGRPDLAGGALAKVRAPTLLIVGGEDRTVLMLNRQARDAMSASVVLEVVPGAGHLFEEPGALSQVAALAARHLSAHLGPATPAG